MVFHDMHMTQRHPVQDGIFLVTTITIGRSPLFQNPAYAREAIETLYRVQERHAFFIYGFVCMPDHCHLLLEIPEGGSISKIMNVYKGIVSANIGKGPIWQRRFHLRIAPDIKSTLQYIRMNPVHAGLVESPADYPWSYATGKWDVMDAEW